MILDIGCTGQRVQLLPELHENKTPTDYAKEIESSLFQESKICFLVDFCSETGKATVTTDPDWSRWNKPIYDVPEDQIWDQDLYWKNIKSDWTRPDIEPDVIEEIDMNYLTRESEFKFRIKRSFPCFLC